MLDSRRILCAAAVGALVAGGLLIGERRSDAKRAAAPVLPYPVHQRTLDNGLRVIVIPLPGSGLASVRLAVRTGARDEYEPGHTGFAHFFEHMMFRGTVKYPQAVYQRFYTELGAATNAYTSADMTVYKADVAAEDLGKVLEVEADRFMNLDYPKQAFQTEAGAVYGEYRKNRSTPGYQLEEAIARTAFTRHTYAHLTIGFEKDIAAMPSMYDYSRSFFQRYYRPENTIVLITGDVVPEATLKLVEEQFGPWKRGYKAPKIAAEPRQNAERTINVTYEGKSLPIVALAYKAEAYDPRSVDYAASLVLVELGFGETSALNKKLVLGERVVQELEAEPAHRRDPGLVRIDAVVADPTKVDYVKAELDRAITALRENLPEQAQVDAARSRLRYSLLMRFDSAAGVADALAPIAAVTGGVEAVNEADRSLAQVTPAHVQAAARRILDTRRRTVAILREKQP
jgi:zinc protease